MNSVTCMKNFVLSVLVAGFAVVLLPSLSMAQSKAQQEQDDVGEAIKMELAACGKAMPRVAEANRKKFKQSRLKDTLHGIWRGRVSGEYEKHFMGEDGFLNVDYYMIVDMGANEALILEQLSPKRAAAPAQPGAPTWSFLMCGGQYLPPGPPQIHEFQKVSNNVEEGRAMLEISTGMKFGSEDLSKEHSFLSGAWKKMVDEKYFDDAPYAAYAGGLFKPFKVENSLDESGQPVLQLEFDSEYRGGGGTAAEFQKGVPISGFERGQFVGVTSNEGDYLFSSIGNDIEEWFKSAIEGGLIQVFMEKVVIGPLASEIFSISEMSYDASKDEITMAWPSSGGTPYTIERSADSKEWTEIGTVIGTNNETNFTDRRLPTEKDTLFYRVRR